MTAEQPSADAAAFCAALVREHDYGRYAATLFVDPETRRALLSLYAFNVEIVRVRDQVTQPLPGEVRLQWWRDMLTGEAHGGVAGHPVAAELLRTVQRFALPVDRLTRLIDEHQFDLYNDPMPTGAALDGYLGDTQAALIVTAAQIAVPPSPEIDHLARHAGLAQGIVQVIASLPRDAARRQLFVPRDLLERHGSSPDEVFAGQRTPAIRSAIHELATEAGQHLQTALELLPEAPGELRPILLPVALLRRDIARVMRPDHDPFQPQARAHLSTLWTLWRASRSRAFRTR
jgi:15-cis-phytoene synthase